MRPAVVLLALLLSPPAAGVQPRQPLESVPSRYASLDGARVHYKSMGTGAQALVLVHGWTCDLTFWRAQAPDLALRTRLILVDLPGHGLSDKPQLAYSMPLMARGVLAVLDQEHVTEAVLVGHSMAALVVRHALELQPRRVRGLVLVDGSLRPYFKTREAGERFRAPFRADFAAALGKAIDSFTAGMRPADRARVKAAMLGTSAHVGLSAMEGMHDPAAHLGTPIAVPLGAIVADSAHWAGYEAFLRGLQPRLDYRVMKGVGHFLMIDKPDEFNALLVSVLQGQGFLPADPK